MRTPTDPENGSSINIADATMIIAQTNLQLYNQLLNQGYTSAQCAAVRNGYELAMRLFSSKFRASGKPFLSHLVGTASLIAWLGRPVHEVVAALLHASFDAGDFADGARHVTPHRSRIVEQQVGHETLATIVAYYETPRRVVLQMVDADGASLAPRMRSIALIHLCDTIEEYSDSGMCYAPNKVETYVNAHGDQVVQEALKALANLGMGSRLAPLVALCESWERTDLPGELISHRSGSYQVLPDSCHERLSVRAKRFWNKMSRKLAGDRSPRATPQESSKGEIS